MMGHLNGCMLLGFRNENKNETLELLYPEPRRGKKRTLRLVITQAHFPNVICSRECNFLVTIHISRTSVTFSDL